MCYKTQNFFFKIISKIVVFFFGCVVCWWGVLLIIIERSEYKFSSTAPHGGAPNVVFSGIQW